MVAIAALRHDAAREARREWLGHLEHCIWNELEDVPIPNSDSGSEDAVQSDAARDSDVAAEDVADACDSAADGVVSGDTINTIDERLASLGLEFRAGFGDRVFGIGQARPIGQLQFIHGSTLSLKAVCFSHADEHSGAASSSSAPPPARARRRPRGCSCLISGNTEFWPTVSALSQWLKDGTDMGAPAHAAADVALRREYSAPK